MVIPDHLCLFLGLGIIQTFLWHTSAEITLTGCRFEDGLEICTFPGGPATTFVLPTQSLPDEKSSSATETLHLTDPSASPSITEPPIAALSSSTGSVDAQTTAVTACHVHGSTQYCINGVGDEVKVLVTATASPLPTAYTGCHKHGAKSYCIAPDGKEVEILAPATPEETQRPGNAEDNNKKKSGGKNCHYHAGVEHCVSDDESHDHDCGRRDRDYNVSLRIGLLFVILITSAIGVFSPIMLNKLLKIHPKGILFTFVKQFGTGIIIATGFIHLLTHAELMFANRCLGELKYESTATSIAMAGAFIAFMVDYFSHCLVQKQLAKATKSAQVTSEENYPDEKKSTDDSKPGLADFSHHNHNHGQVDRIPVGSSISLLILEAGIIFHSLLIGITLVVAGDSVFITLFIVIIFHQMFEGLALGARIATSKTAKTGNAKLYLLPLVFSFVTPLGMAIGIGVLQSFNGNDKGTIITLGTLDALSAGILIWVGFVDMWAGDWMFGDLVDASWTRVGVGVMSLVAGFALMGLLGKWA